MAKVKLSLRERSPDQTVALTNNILTALTGNAVYPSPNPDLASVTALKDSAAAKIVAYNVAMSAAAAALSERDAVLAELRRVLGQLAAYVENASGGDRAKIESAGMSVRADSAPVGPLPPVPNLRVTASAFEGRLNAAWDLVHGAGGYEIQTSVDPLTPDSWTLTDASIKSTTSLNNLTSGSRMWVRVRAIGARNAKGPWSDPAVKTVP